MKTLAHMYVWWPRLHTDIEEIVSHCPNCQVNHSTPPDGRQTRGPVYTLILPVHLEAKLFSS